MGYTEVESAILLGFIGRYFEHREMSDEVRAEYEQFCIRLSNGEMKAVDYSWAEKALLLLRPMWWIDREDHQALSDLLLKTQLLLKSTWRNA